MIQASLCALHPPNRFVSFFTFSQSRVSGLQSVPLLADGRVRVALFAPHYPQLCGSGFYCLDCSLQLRCNQEDRRIGFDQRFEAFLLFPGPSIAAVACHRKSPFSYFGSLKELSCERMCRTVSIMARIASGRVSGALCLAIQASRALRCEGCRRTPIKVPLPVGGGPLRFFVITV
jgi:hypothetical protein